jgi:hypothetical protein
MLMNNDLNKNLYLDRCNICSHTDDTEDRGISNFNKKIFGDLTFKFKRYALVSVCECHHVVHKLCFIKRLFTDLRLACPICEHNYYIELVEIDTNLYEKIIFYDYGFLTFSIFFLILTLIAMNIVVYFFVEVSLSYRFWKSIMYFFFCVIALLLFLILTNIIKTVNGYKIIKSLKFLKDVDNEDQYIQSKPKQQRSTIINYNAAVFKNVMQQQISEIRIGDHNTTEVLMSFIRKRMDKSNNEIIQQKIDNDITRYITLKKDYKEYENKYIEYSKNMQEFRESSMNELKEKYNTTAIDIDKFNEIYNNLDYRNENFTKKKESLILIENKRHIIEDKYFYFFRNDKKKYDVKKLKLPQSLTINAKKDTIKHWIDEILNSEIFKENRENIKKALEIFVSPNENLNNPTNEQCQEIVTEDPNNNNAPVKNEEKVKEELNNNQNKSSIVFNTNVDISKSKDPSKIHSIMKLSKNENDETKNKLQHISNDNENKEPDNFNDISLKNSKKLEMKLQNLQHLNEMAVDEKEKNENIMKFNNNDSYRSYLTNGSKNNLISPRDKSNLIPKATPLKSMKSGKSGKNKIGDSNNNTTKNQSKPIINNKVSQLNLNNQMTNTTNFNTYLNMSNNNQTHNQNTQILNHRNSNPNNLTKSKIKSVNKRTTSNEINIGEAKIEEGNYNDNYMGFNPHQPNRNLLTNLFSEESEIALNSEHSKHILIDISDSMNSMDNE